MYTKNNELLAEFIGFDILSNGYYQYQAELTRALPEFNSDWNWLMKAVEKIENYNEFVSVLFTSQGCAIDVYIKNGFSFCNDCDTKIEAVYNACVVFVKWYNNQNK